MNPATPQPAPTPNNFPRIVDLVVDDLYQRADMGLQKYGVPLQPFNGRDPEIDEYQELMDSLLYRRQRIYERDCRPPIEQRIATIEARIANLENRQEKLGGG